MSESYPTTHKEKVAAEDKILAAIDSEAPTVFVERSSGKLDGGWIPYDTELIDANADINNGNLVVHLAKVKENPEDGYDLKILDYNEFARIQDEVKAIEGEALMQPEAERADRVRAVRMSAAYRKMRQNFNDNHLPKH